MPAGRPKGTPKTGGRKKGSANVKTRALADQANSDGITPLAYMLSVLRDEKSEKTEKQWAADKAAPYIHPRLQTSVVTGRDGGPIKIDDVGSKELARRLAFILASGSQE